MDARELRVGNYFDYDGRILRLDKDALIGFLLDPEEKLRPVTLTEDWLVRMGWIWNEECKSFEKYPNGDVRMNLQFRRLNGSYSMFNYVLRAKICENIFYVHQLQNLYFALTGEELEIKQ